MAELKLRDNHWGRFNNLRLSLIVEKHDSVSIRGIDGGEMGIVVCWVGKGNEMKTKLR